MRDACAGLQHQTRDAANRDVGPYARLVDDDERAVEHVEVPVFDIEN